MLPSNSVCFLSVILLFINKQLVISASVGDTCVDETNKLSGTCQLIFDCPHIIRRKLSGGTYTKCGFNDNQQEIVCCGERKITSSTGDEIPIPAKKYAQKCEQYKSDSFDTKIYKLTATQSIEHTISKCYKYTFPLVVGGDNAYPREFPHMALLGCKDEKGKYIWACGGSLISNKYILSAAHCFEANRCGKLDIVRLGDLNVEVDTDDAKPKDFKIAHILPHPEYNNSVRYNDIALVELETEVEFNDYIRPACLPYQDFNNQSQLIVTGWGSTRLAGKNAAHLQKAGVEQFDQTECNEIYSEDNDSSLPSGVTDRTQICAGSKQDIQDTCQGDSGGPLQSVHPKHPCMYSIIGITSYGQSCGIVGFPGIYTRVYYYTNWIESVVWD